MQLSMFSILAASLSLLALNVQAADSPSMEKCNIVDAKGKGLIKANKGDCKSVKNSCAGQNAAGDPDTWVFVPQGLCDRIDGGKVVKS